MVGHAGCGGGGGGLVASSATLGSRGIGFDSCYNQSLFPLQLHYNQYLRRAVGGGDDQAEVSPVL